MTIHLERGELVLGPPADHPKWRTHAQGPTVLPLEPGLVRIYFAGRDGYNMSRVYAADITLPDMRVVDLLDEPLLDVGVQGAFDMHGVGPGSVLRDGERVLLYYSGVAQRQDVPYHCGIGLAVSEDGGRSFRRVREEPIVGPAPDRPIGGSTASVVRIGDTWAMWFSNYLEFRLVEGKPEPIYDLMGATSRDGLEWTIAPQLRIPLEGGDEGGLTRAALFEGRKGWHMLLSTRGWRDFRAGRENSYHLCTATALDGLHFTREPAGVTFERAPREGDWDFEMQAYPSIVRDGDRWYVFYNGNGFGRDGFGYAVLSERDGEGRP